MSVANQIDLFWKKIDKDGPTPKHRPELGACWIWTACRNKAGYGLMAFEGRTRIAHRISWRIEHGEHPPSKQFICHACDNPTCIRPSHLFSGDALVNMLDKVAKGRARGAAKGEVHHAAKLTPQKVLDIRERYGNRKLDWVTQKSLAEEYGLHQVTISEIVTRKIWSHI